MPSWGAAPGWYAAGLWPSNGLACPGPLALALDLALALALDLAPALVRNLDEAKASPAWHQTSKFHPAGADRRHFVAQRGYFAGVVADVEDRHPALVADAE